MKNNMDNLIEELLPFYALGALTDEERELVEDYLGEHPEVRAQIKEMEFAASALPYSAPPVKPSDRLKKTLMERIAADQRARSSVPVKDSLPRPAKPQNRFMGILQFSFGALSLVVAVMAIALLYGLNRQVSQLQGEVAALKSALVAQANRVEQLNQAFDEVNANLPQATPSALTVFAINGTEVQPDAHGQLMTDPNSHSAVLVVAGLPPLQAGMTYQIWLIEGDTPKSAGLLNVDDYGQGVSILTPDQAFSSFDALGISIEPEEGSLLPTGDIVMLGQFN